MVDSISVSKKKRKLLIEIKENFPLLLLALPGFILLVMFNYAPMSGLILAFKDYTMQKGIFGSDWADPIFRNFYFFFRSFSTAMRSVRNTIGLNFLFFGFGSLVSISIAIMLSELTKRWFVKITQSVIFFPYFISWTVLGCILTTSVLKFDGGIVNNALSLLGIEPFDFYANPYYWVPILTICSAWQSAGYSSVIYYAVLTGFDPSYYEAAVVDGATKWQQITLISLPLLRPTFITLFLLSLGGMLRGNLSMMLGLTNLNPSLLPVTDVIDVFVYRTSIRNSEMAFSSAISLFQSIFGFCLVMLSNALVRKADRELALF